MLFRFQHYFACKTYRVLTVQSSTYLNNIFIVIFFQWGDKVLRGRKSSIYLWFFVVSIFHQNPRFRLWALQKNGSVVNYLHQKIGSRCKNSMHPIDSLSWVFLFIAMLKFKRKRISFNSIFGIFSFLLCVLKHAFKWGIIRV